MYSSEANNSTEAVLPASSDAASFGIQKKSDCYRQKFIKFDAVGTFHSLSELLYAALLESDIKVSTFTPQPTPFLIAGKKYFPDCFYVRKGKRHYVELKPKGVFNREKRIPMEEHGRSNDFEFLVVSNEEILSQKVKADNWLRIVRVLVSAAFENTEGEELEIIQRLNYEPSLALFEIIDAGDRIQRRFLEIALFRLAHRGIVSLDLDNESINPSTEVTLCD